MLKQVIQSQPTHSMLRVQVIPAHTKTGARRGYVRMLEGDKLTEASDPQGPQLPTGEDRLLLTMCLEFAYNNPGLDLDTSHFEWIVRRNNFTTPPGLVLDATHDIAALQRLENRVPTPPKP